MSTYPAIFILFSYITLIFMTKCNRLVLVMIESTLFYTVYPHKTSKVWGSFVHIAGGRSAIWFRQIEAYQKDYNILLPLLNLRGHGKSNY